MKICTRYLMFLLIIGLALLLSACKSSDNKKKTTENETTTTITTTNSDDEIPDEEFVLAGEYAIDITNLGMALTFYLKIDEDDNFMLSPSRDFLVDKGSGTIGELDGTYMMIYHDSTPEQSKTATFARIGHNLIFRSTLPYGTSNIMYEAEDEEDPSIIYHLMADKFVYEDYYNTYLGFYSEDDVDYEYVLTLKAGARYHYVSRYEDGNDTVEYEETGSFRVHNDIILLTPEGGTELLGSITDEGGLEIQVKLTETEERCERLLRVATTADYAGSWYAYESGADYEANGTLELDYFGGYTFTSNYGDGTYVETGSFEMDGTSITFTSSEGGAAPVVGTKANFMITVLFDLSDTITDVEWCFYDETIQGILSGYTKDDVNYLSTLELKPDGTYELLIVDEDNNNAELLNEIGTFSISAGPMSYMITLTAENNNTSVGAIWDAGLNIPFEISGTSYSFLLAK